MSNHYSHMAVHRNAAIFEVVRDFDRILLSLKFHDGISNGSRVFALTNGQTHKRTDTQTDTTENISPSLRCCCMGGN